MVKDRLVTAIDIGTFKITVVIAAAGGDRHQPQVAGVSSLKSEGVRKGQVVDIDKVIGVTTKAIEAAERMAGVTVASALISVGGEHIESLNSKGVVAVAEPEAEIKKTDVDRVIEAAKAVSLPSTREILHILPRQFIVDGQSGIADPIGMTGVRLEAETHLITGSTTSIRNLAKCVSDIGIDVAGVVFSGLASSTGVLTSDEKELGVVLVDIGAGTTDICVFVEGGLAYSGVIPVGASHVTNDLAIGLRVSLESAEKIKMALGKAGLDKEKKGIKTLALERNSGRGSAHDEIDLTKLRLAEGLEKVSFKTAVEGIIKPRVEEIMRLIGEKIIDSGFGGQTPAGIVLTGGGAKTIGAVQIGRRELALPIRIGLPLGLSGLTEEIEGSEFAAIWGLIVSAKVEEEKGFNLPKLPKFGKMMNGFEIKGVGKKLVELVKSFLP